jgi:hypothetical protein
MELLFSNSLTYCSCQIFYISLSVIATHAYMSVPPCGVFLGITEALAWVRTHYGPVSVCLSVCLPVLCSFVGSRQIAWQGHCYTAALDHVGATLTEIYFVQQWKLRSLLGHIIEPLMSLVQQWYLHVVTQTHLECTFLQSCNSLWNTLCSIGLLLPSYSFYFAVMEQECICGHTAQ